MKQILNIILLAAVLFIISACDGAGGPGIETVNFQEDNSGYIQFSTNDTDYYGWTLWHYYDATEATPSGNLEVEYIKKSGSYWPSGVIFNYLDNQNFCHMQLTTHGYYSIVEKYNNSNTSIVDWKTSSFIHQGLNVSNKVKVEWNNATSEFLFYINDNLAEIIPLSSFPSGRNGGKAGFIVAVGNEDVEDFPGAPADFRFKMIQPVTVP